MSDPFRAFVEDLAAFEPSNRSEPNMTDGEGELRAFIEEAADLCKSPAVDPARARHAELLLVHGGDRLKVARAMLLDLSYALLCDVLEMPHGPGHALAAQAVAIVQDARDRVAALQAQALEPERAA